MTDKELCKELQADKFRLLGDLESLRTKYLELVEGDHALEVSKLRKRVKALEFNIHLRIEAYDRLLKEKWENLKPYRELHEEIQRRDKKSLKEQMK